MLDQKEEPGNENNYDKEYLYLDRNDAHPVIEYKLNSLQTFSEKDHISLEGDNNDGSITPFFMLEVTWPRLVQFYYPSSSTCQSYKSKFIQMARTIRHYDKRDAVQFYTISCAVHTEVCEEQQPEYFKTHHINSPDKNNAPPLVVAFEMGSINGNILQPKKQQADNEGNDDFDYDLSYVAEMLDIDLVMSFEDHQSQKLSNNIREDNPLQLSLKNLEVSSRLDEIYADATSSFFAMLKYNIYPINTIKDKDNLASIQLDQRKVDILKDFLDLCHWSLPSAWNIHGVLNDLRNEFSTVISEGSRGIRQIVRRHDQNGLFQNKWSSACHTSDGHRVQDINYSASQCGMWKFLHILSIGIAEQPKNRIMGDSLRVTPSYAAIVIRDFVEEFFSNTDDVIFCDGCRDKIVKSYDACNDHYQTYYPGENIQEEQIVISLCSPNFWSVTKENAKSITAWRHVAIWLWGVHNEMHDETNSYNGAISYVWPGKNDCPSCQNIHSDENSPWNTDSVYDYLLGVYWPQSKIQNARITVLPNFVRRNVQNRRIGRTGFLSLWFGPVKNQWMSSSIMKSMFVLIFLSVFYIKFSDKIFLLRSRYRQFSTQLKQNNHKNRKVVTRSGSDRQTSASTNMKSLHLQDRPRRRNNRPVPEESHFRVTNNNPIPIFLDA